MMPPLQLLERVADECGRLFGANMTGFYAHGSLALGCYNPRRSDLDFIVVLEETPSIDEKADMMRVLIDLERYGPEKGFEMSAVLRRYCKPFAYPTPFEAHFSSMWREKCRADVVGYCEEMRGTDYDLAAHFTVIRRAGIALRGAPIAEVFGEVPREDYFDSISRDALDAENGGFEENPVYYALNFCRVAACAEEGLVLSKAEGGRWGLERLPAEYRGVVRAALAAYASEEKAEDADMLIGEGAARAREFCEYMLARIGLGKARVLG